MKRVICAAILVLVASPSPASAIHVQSPGCQRVNSDFLDGPAEEGFVIEEQFFAGETVTVTADYPIVRGDDPTQVILTLEPSGTVVDSAGFPGTVTYTFPADTMTGSLHWFHNSITAAVVTWTVSCQGAVHAYPLAVSAAQPSTKVAAPAAAVAVESGERTAFPLAAVGIAGLAVLVQVGVWAGVTRHRRMAG